MKTRFPNDVSILHRLRSISTESLLYNSIQSYCDTDEQDAINSLTIKLFEPEYAGHVGFTSPGVFHTDWTHPERPSAVSNA